MHARPDIPRLRQIGLTRRDLFIRAHRRTAVGLERAVKRSRLLTRLYCYLKFLKNGHSSKSATYTTLNSMGVFVRKNYSWRQMVFSISIRSDKYAEAELFVAQTVQNLVRSPADSKDSLSRTTDHLASALAEQTSMQNCLSYVRFAVRAAWSVMSGKSPGIVWSSSLSSVIVYLFVVYSGLLNFIWLRNTTGRHNYYLNGNPGGFLTSSSK